MMLRYIDHAPAADRVEAALAGVLRARKRVTRDLGGTASTEEMAMAIVERLRSS